MRYMKLLIIVGVVGAFGIGFMVTSRVNTLPQGKIDILTSPIDAKIQLDGNAIKADDHLVDIGKHVVRVSADGFESYETTVDVTQSTPTDIPVTLKAVSADAINLMTDSAERKRSEGISSRSNDARSENFSREYPLLARLPVVFGNGGGGLTKINKIAAVSTADIPSIGIAASSPSGRKAALEWVKNRNYSFDDIDVVFYGSNIPIRGDVDE